MAVEVFVSPRLDCVLLALAVLSGCSGTDTWDPPDEVREQLQAILGGEPTEHWPAVGVYNIDGGYGGMCTAALVAPDMVLTAAHCAADSTEDDNFITVSQLSEAIWSDVHAVAEAIPHPNYNGNAQHPHDIALLRLVDPIEDIDFIPVYTGDATDWAGTWLHYVGFGANTYFGGPGAGLKRETDLQIAWASDYEFSTYAMDSNYCSGDSGGPGFIDVAGRWYVAGVVSSVYALDQGEDMCEGGGWSMRVDAEIGFLDNHYDTHIEPDEWYQWPDAPGDDDDSAAGDDDDSAAGDDDDDDSAPIGDDDEDGCECALPAGSGSGLPASVFLLAAIAALATRRRPAG